MPRANGIYSVIHPASGATLSAYTYYEIYAGTAGGTATINGTVVNLAAGTGFDIIVRTISSISGNIYLLGENKSLSSDGNYIGGTY
tara:strand:+ start:19762 stop:20019 length:258 start_codon:yes stop_codon:yes gene_type:complete